MCPAVAYGTSAGAAPFGQSRSLPGESGRACELTNAATSNACWSVSEPRLFCGIIWRMNDAARSFTGVDAGTAGASVSTKGRDRNGGVLDAAERD